MKIIIFIPYFGKLPQYFAAFLSSISGQKMVDFVVFTDDPVITRLPVPDNLRYEIWSFERMRRLVRERTGYQLFHPYKLCDFRPCYGLLFNEYIQFGGGYDYWGYCDVDALWGDMSGWLLTVASENYDRIGRYGHFTIYRNTDELRGLYLKGDEDSLPMMTRMSYVAGTAFPCNFDERGMNMICEHAGLRFLKDVPMLNSSWGYKHLHSWNEREQYQVWLWENGRVFSLIRDAEGIISREERAYLHFMLFNLPQLTPWADRMCVTHEGIRSCSDMSYEQILDRFGVPDTPEEHRRALVTTEKKRKAKTGSRIVAEFKYCGLRAVPNILMRFLSLLARENVQRG